MISRDITHAPAALWQLLLENGVVTGKMPESGLALAPWFIRLMLGIAGWIAAFLLLGFMAAVFTQVFDDELSSIVTALVMMTLAWLILMKFGRTDFAEQFGLAISFSGQILFSFGVFQWLGTASGDMWSWIVIMDIQIVLTLVMPSVIHRFWSGFSAVCALYMTTLAAGLTFLPSFIVLAGVCLLWLSEYAWRARNTMIRPIAYGLVVAMIIMDPAIGMLHALLGFDGDFTGTRFTSPVFGQGASLWLGQVLLGSILLWLVWRLLSQGGKRVQGKGTWAAIGATLLIILVSLKAPGIAIGICILLLGFAHSNHFLLGLGLLSLLTYISTYYYTLDTTLLDKSQTLALTGALMFALRCSMQRWIVPHGKEIGGEKNGSHR